MSDTTYAENIRVGELQAAKDVADPFGQMRKQFFREERYFKGAADAMASTTTAETIISSLVSDGIVLQVDVTTDAAVAANGSNFASIIITKRDAAAANPLVVATFATSSVGFTQWVRRSATSTATGLTVANTQVVNGGLLTLTITKGGTGVIVPALEIVCRVLDQ